ncbi:MAG: glycosyltransferase [Crocinitomicaceae bacterium]|nr:glycosyltransferase [Crocinitomicaceae bacterium]
MPKTPRALVSVTNDLYTDQRVHKVCTFISAQGYDVMLIGRKRKASIPLPSRDYKTKRIRLLFETGAKFYAFFNLRLFFVLLFNRADILVSNDLDTLLANYAASKFKRSCRLVYDSHEYFTEVPELLNRPKVRNVWLKIEQHIFPKLVYIYTVNNSIAKIYSEKYTKDISIVRNISPRWQQNNLKSKAELGLPEDKSIIIIQGAGINIDRGAEEAVEAMKNIDALLLIVGDGDVVPQLKEYVEQEQLHEKIRFVGRQPYETMMNYTHHADIGLTLDKPTSLNYKLSLPNKVFDYMHTCTAVVATRIVEVAKVVETHEIGTIVEPFSVESLTETLNSLLSDSSRLETYKVNCKKAAVHENWETEMKVMSKFYPKVNG